ncbi:hypothetical protein KNE206_59050 [Kitasatospora sp. NE20-6]
MLRTGFAQDAFDKALPLLTGRIRELGGQRKPFGQDRHEERLRAVSIAAAEDAGVISHSLHFTPCEVSHTAGGARRPAPVSAVPEAVRRGGAARRAGPGQCRATPGPYPPAAG